MHLRNNHRTEYDANINNFEDLLTMVSSDVFGIPKDMEYVKMKPEETNGGDEHVNGIN